MKLCMIGCGEHAFSSHGPAQALYAASHPGVELAGCCDVDAAKASEFRKRFGFERAYTDLDSMLDAERPDAAALVVPVGLTCEVGSHILSRGVPLLIEKPPGETVVEADRLASAARAGGRGGRDVSHQVAFNRRFVPLVVALRERVARLPADSPLQHIRYEMVRVNRRDPDFSTTAVHAIDAVRAITGADYDLVRFRYQDLPDFGPGVANIFMDATMTSGASAHLSFCPVAGVVVERAEVHARDRSFFVEIPMWNGYDSPGRLVHLERGALAEELTGAAGTVDPPFVLGGFYGEYQAFLGDLAAGRTPTPTVAEARQSVEVAEAMRARRSEWRS